MRQLLALIVITLWAAFATYKWIATYSKTDSLIENAIIEAQLNAQKLADEQAEKARLEAEVKTNDIKIVYKTIKNVVYKNRVVSKCTGDFPAELRMGLSEATATANGEVPAAQH